jgi:hypothetical protein
MYEETVKQVLKAHYRAALTARIKNADEESWKYWQSRTDLLAGIYFDLFNVTIEGDEK